MRIQFEDEDYIITKLAISAITSTERSNKLHYQPSEWATYTYKYNHWNQSDFLFQSEYLLKSNTNSYATTDV